MILTNINLPPQSKYYLIIVKHLIMPERQGPVMHAIYRDYRDNKIQIDQPRAMKELVGKDQLFPISKAPRYINQPSAHENLLSP